MFIIQHLQHQRDEFQKQYDLLSMQIQRLGDAYAVEIDPTIELKLEKQMEYARAKRGRAADQIQALDDQIETLDNSARLYKALSKLNYYSQVGLFRQVLERSQVGALVIYGERGFGQDWLLKRLLSRIPFKMTSQVVQINLQSFMYEKNRDTIRNQFKRYPGLAHLHSLEEIAKQVHQWWQTQTVILEVYNLSLMNEQYIKEFFQNFWLPLVEKTQREPCQSPFYQMLVFLIESSDSVNTWPIICAEQIDSVWEPHIPIKLPRLTRFSREVLTQWIEYESETLPSKIRSVPVEDILNNSDNGIPQFIMEYICELCDCNVIY